MRYLVQNKIQSLNGVDIYDPTSIDWTSYDWTTGFFVHTITKFEILKPYLISYLYYNTTDYEDVILLLNNIDDIFELPVGTQIKVPILDNLKTFILNNRK
jgi:hypothetical protein